MIARSRILFSLLFLSCLSGLAQTLVIPNVWINELHYNNTGADTLTGFEIAGPTGTNLACYEVVLYDGSIGQEYLVDTLTGVLPNVQSGFGTSWFNLAPLSIQNINNGGLALVYAPQATGCGVNNQDTVLQFLAYGGAFTALNGRAQGITSINLPVSENSGTALGTSLQLGGLGNKYSDFNWQASLSITYGLRNFNQSFAPVIQFDTTIAVVGEHSGSYDIAISLTNYDANPDTVYIDSIAGSTAIFGVNYQYSPNFVVFPGGSSSTQYLTVTIIDDFIASGGKSAYLQLTNPTNQATIGAHSSFQLLIYNEDTLKISIPPPNAITVSKTAGVITFPVNVNFGCVVSNSVRVSVYSPGTTAVIGQDYLFNGTIGDTTIVWAPFQRGDIQVPVVILDDTFNEPDVVVQFILSNPDDGSILLDSMFTITILELDTFPPASINFDTTQLTIENPDSDIIFQPVHIVGVNHSYGPVNFYVGADVSSSTAIKGNASPADFQITTQALTIPAYSSIDTGVFMNVFSTTEVSPTKTVVMKFSQVQGRAAVGKDSVFTLYITNHNKLKVSFLGAGLSYTKDTAMVQVPVVLSSLSPRPVSANVTLAPGSAVPGVDFTFNDSTVVFPAFSRDTQGVWVHIINNSLYQPNKQINFNLSDPTNGALLGITGYTITIINNDSLAQGIIPVGAAGSISLSPNPVSNLLCIQNNSEPFDAVITDMLGRVMFENIKLSMGSNYLDVSFMHEGMYLLSPAKGVQTSCFRFIKGE